MNGIEERLRDSARGAGSGSGEDADRPTGGAAARLVRRAADEGLVDVAYTQLDSPLGPLLVAATPRGLVRLAYDGENPDPILEGLARRVSPRVLDLPERLDPVRRELDEYFEGRRREFDLALDWTLTAGFSRRVLQATAEVPFGRVTSYREVAEAAGASAAARAAGNALGSNPMPIVVPCHRVLRSAGTLGGYTGGLHRKRYLLGLEGVAV